MSTHLVTGKAGYEHVKASDHGALHAAIMGGGEFVLEGGEQFACQVISNNKVRIFDGEALMQGRHIRIDRNTYEETTHDNGVQGYKRFDLIVLTYTKDEGTGVENVALEVIKGTPSESNPSVPSYVTGDILNNGELKNQMPLYKIPFDGLSIGEPVKMFTTVPTLQTMKEEVDAKVDAKIAEMEESIDEKIAEGGKPLSSNASDWALIENYDEFSADAKTVGEEFAKVNNMMKWWIDNGYLPDPNNPMNELIPTMTSNTKPSGVVSSSGDYTSGSDTYSAYKAFDKNATSSESCWMSTSVSGSWLQYQFPNAVTVRKVEITNRYRTDNANVNAPKEFIVQGSNNGSEWTDLGTFTNNSPDSAVKHSYNFANDTAYSYYRLYFNSGHGTARIAIGELQMYGI